VLGNAFKYAPGSSVLLGPRRRHGRIALQVLDTGPGFDSSHAESVFAEYVRLEADDRLPQVEGMGLGLSIVRRLSSLLDLDVSLQSQPGSGTSVMISGLASTRPLNVRREPTALNHPLSGRRICLVEDDDTVRAATSSLLERWGCAVTAWTGKEAITGDYDAVVSDMYLGPESDGLSVVTSLRSGSDPQLPAIILTGLSDEATLARIADAGIPVLPKPVAPTELRAALTRLCLDADALKRPASNG
jgi:CheY-like chemotaxis protein